MSINNLFETSFKHGAFIAYLTGGYPDLDYTEKAALALMNQGGVDLLEMGVPFSDPIADGPTIQQAMQSAVDLGVGVEDVLNCIQRIKRGLNEDKPIVLFSYYNPLLQCKHLIERMSEAGVDGLLVVDLAYEGAYELDNACLAQGVAPIHVAAPSTPLSRIQLLTQHGRGFLYYACRKGTTGAKRDLPEDLKVRLEAVKAHSHLPVGVGFGISDAKHAHSVLGSADGFVVGSRLIKAISEGALARRLAALAREIDPRNG